MKGVFVVFLIFILCVGEVSSARADEEAWENGKAYTAMLKDAAIAAALVVSEATRALAAAENDLQQANRALRLAGDAARRGATVRAVLAAQQAVRFAAARLAAATAAAKVAAAVAAGATAGTLIGQGLRGLWHLCWDPVCPALATNVTQGPIYLPATDREIEALVPELVFIGTGLSLGIDDFVAAGDAGLLSLAFISEGAHMFIGVARGAAAAAAGRWGEVLIGVSDLKRELVSYRATIEAFADVLAATAFQSPVPDLVTARAELDAAVSEARTVCSPAEGDDCVALNLALDEATAAFQAAQDAVVAVNFPSLVGGANPAFTDLTLQRFHQFLADTALLGAAALPVGEINLADRLLQEARAFFPGTPSLGPALAAYDATGDIGGRESALFDPVTGRLNLAELLRSSATTLSSRGFWLNIDLATSPVTTQARALISFRCDIDGNGAIDLADIRAIFAVRNTATTPGDPGDADGDGVITVNDARICALVLPLRDP